MAREASLDIALNWDRREDVLWVNLHFDPGGAGADEYFQMDRPLTIAFDRLRAVAHDSESYGRELGQMLLGNDEIQRHYRRALEFSQEDQRPLHLRISLPVTAPARYHGVRWETIRDPQTDDRITIQGRVLFSRYLSNTTWSRIRTRPKQQLRALLAVAAPIDLANYQGGRNLAEAEIQTQADRGRIALSDFEIVEELMAGEATQERLLDAIESGIDVLYLLCHGALVEGFPVLYLEHSDRTTHAIDGRRLVELVGSLDHRPTVAMLLSCQSVIRGDEAWAKSDEALSALGPRLVDAGVATVVAMQGDISVQTAGDFASKFFADLAEHGIVDRATTTARRSVEDRPDWWVPVLYSRLRFGQTYYEPAFTKEPAMTWENLRLQASTGNLLPIIGPDLADSVLGSREDIARHWVKRWQMPLAPHTHGNLTQVAQFLRVRGGPGVVRAQMIDHLNGEISRRIADPEHPAHGVAHDPAAPQDTIIEIARIHRRADPDDPHRILASLRVPIYLTTAWTDTLEDALRDCDPPKEPMTRAFNWHEPVDISAQELPAPTVARPLVYHLFGRLEDRQSLVLTEDDYYGWYAAWLRKRRHVPALITSELFKKSLVFLGFQLDDWDFRVFFQAIKSLDGRKLLLENQHVAVQLSPESQSIDYEAAQEYLESYFGTDQVSIFWGPTKAFLADLRQRIGM